MLRALTLLNADWNESYHRDWLYAGVADEMRRRGVPDEDLHELFRRMCYNALAGNSDHHPRNHAIIHIQGHWRLSPMYDVLPILEEDPAKTLAMAVGRDAPKLVAPTYSAITDILRLSVSRPSICLKRSQAGKKS